ncbi:MAG TPA: lysine-2,3-aminomutase-like protein [Stellaceae bacterium]|nr:lysine-2,3-aminomutase-like protein [Stellaceae bacterium]
MAARSLRKISGLVARGLVPDAHAATLERVAERYAVAITPAMADLMDPSDPADPIARQFVPDLAELVVTPEERADPIGDERLSPVKGIVHRYPDRVLLKPLHTCPVYCRFCFRREQVGPGGEGLSAAETAAALAYISARPEIWEVIVTGGDPFLLSTRRLSTIVRALDEIEHVQVIRFHTRVPVVDPARVDARLVAALGSEKALYVAIHANHPRELTPEFRAACRRLAKAGIPLLAQSVLLKGVNDDAAVLETLFRGLVAARVKPYYLHHHDLARGTGHFRVTLREGQALMRRLRGRVSGLCQPSYVLDLPGGFGKVPVGPCYAEPRARSRGWIVEDFWGGWHRYPPVSGSE